MIPLRCSKYFQYYDFISEFCNAVIEISNASYFVFHFSLPSNGREFFSNRLLFFSLTHSLISKLWLR